MTSTMAESSSFDGSNTSENASRNCDPPQSVADTAGEASPSIQDTEEMLSRLDSVIDQIYETFASPWNEEDAKVESILDMVLTGFASRIRLAGLVVPKSGEGAREASLETLNSVIDQV